MKPFNKLMEAVATPGKGSGNLDVALSTVIPAGKQLVVEFVSTSSEMPVGQKPHPVIVILDNAGSAVVQHYCVTQFQLNYGSADLYKSADPVRMHLPRTYVARCPRSRRHGRNGPLLLRHQRAPRGGLTRMIAATSPLTEVKSCFAAVARTSR